MESFIRNFVGEERNSFTSYFGRDGDVESVRIEGDDLSPPQDRENACIHITHRETTAQFMCNTVVLSVRGIAITITCPIDRPNEIYIYVVDDSNNVEMELSYVNGQHNVSVRRFIVADAVLNYRADDADFDSIAYLDERFGIVALNQDVNNQVRYLTIINGVFSCIAVHCVVGITRNEFSF